MRHIQAEPDRLPGRRTAAWVAAATSAAAMVLIAPPAQAQVEILLGPAGLSLNLPLGQPPHLVRIPGHGVYMAPELNANLFFFDGLYWVYEGGWYTSPSYGGPWMAVAPQQVPAPLLRVPLRFWRAPPGTFHDWRLDAPPRWQEHWGDDWARARRGWNHPGSRSLVPPPSAPLEPPMPPGPVSPSGRGPVGPGGPPPVAPGGQTPRPGTPPHPGHHRPPP